MPDWLTWKIFSQNKINKKGHFCKKTFLATFSTSTKMERTYIMVKPDGVERGLVGEILKRFEAKGYQLTALELMHPTKEHLEEHVRRAT